MHVNGQNYIFEDWNYEEISKIWNSADAILGYNVTYDMGVLSSIPPNTYKWDGTFWVMQLFGQKYKVRRIDGFRNIIRGYPPVIDVLKLWSILVDDGRGKGGISLKMLLKKELGQKIMLWTPEVRKSAEYRLQDVVGLAAVWRRYLYYVDNILDVNGYKLIDWAKVCTPATFCKKSMKNTYPALDRYRVWNIEEDDKYHLTTALQRAYHGGITVSLHRGTVYGTGWYDINGAYAHAIEYLNTDRYLKYKWEKCEYTENEQILCKINTTAHMISINQSLKIFKTRKKERAWAWIDDIQALKLLLDDVDTDILECYRPIPLLDVKVSKAAEWSKLKEIEQKLHGKSTLCRYYKSMSNTCYGITAQRDPYPTEHTNMCIAGKITSKIHHILAKMIHTARNYGCRWIYSDTDSICVELNGVNPKELETRLNQEIDPYTCACEHVGNTRILSLKRYYAYGDIQHPDKIRLHGKSIYKISENTLKSMLMGIKPENRPIKIGSITAATERTYNRILKLDHRITHPHPFMFLTDIESDIGLSDWFSDWFAHIDTKTSYRPNALAVDEYPREIITFGDMAAAEYYYGAHSAEIEEFSEEEIIENSFLS